MHSDLFSLETHFKMSIYCFFFTSIFSLPLPPPKFSSIAVYCLPLQNMMNINYLGTVYATRAVVPLMKSRGRGRIALVSSMAGQCAVYGFTGYCASKFALQGFAEALQMEVTLGSLHFQTTH